VAIFFVCEGKTARKLFAGKSEKLDGEGPVVSNPFDGVGLGKN
jgi:hypothetical protein